MGSLAEFTYGPIELVGWGLQALLIVLVSPWAGGPIRLPEPGVSFCLLVVCLGWLLRLAYLFALASDGFLYWIGDDPVRWLTAWSWLHSPPDELGVVSGWMPGTTLLHGIAMGLLSNPLYASKLVSASYSLFSLAGVFVFAQALFRNRVVSLASVAFLAPFWIDILLSTGTMTEMPTIGALLCGAGALLYGLRMPVGRRRNIFLFCAAVCFAIATLFHMVAWILLTGILLFLLPVFLRLMHGSLLTRLRSWVVFCAISTSWCFVWAIDQWISTGSPFTVFRAAEELLVFKIGGPLDLVAVLGRVASLGELTLVVTTGVALLTVMALYFMVPGENGRVLGRLEVAQLRKARWGALLVAAVLSFLAFIVIQNWLSALAPNVRYRVITNWSVFPVSLVYCLYYYLPLALYGLFVTLRRQEEQDRAPRIVLACIGWTFAILIATSVKGGANLTPFRTVLALSAALLPFSMAPLFTRVSSQRAAPSVARQESGRSTPRTPWLTVGLALLVLGANVAANHTRIAAEIPEPRSLHRAHRFNSWRADLYALGSWMRAELKDPGHLSPENLSHPFEVQVADFAGLKQALIQYHIGDPARLADPHWVENRAPRTPGQLAAQLVPGQVLIADDEIDLAELRLITRLGQYSVYERSRP